MKLWLSTWNDPSRATVCRLNNISSQFKGEARSGRSQARRPNQSSKQRAYLLTEALVYIGLVFVLLGVAYTGLYRFIDNSVLLGRNCEDISRTMHAGERWRADIRSASAGIRLEPDPEGDILQLRTSRGEIDYTTRQDVVLRRVDSGPWVKVLNGVKTSVMHADVQPNVTAWRWELELRPQTKGAIKPGRVRPLFTFIAAPGTTPRL